MLAFWLFSTRIGSSVFARWNQLFSLQHISNQHFHTDHVQIWNNHVQICFLAFTLFSVESEPDSAVGSALTPHYGDERSFNQAGVVLTVVDEWLLPVNTVGLLLLLNFGKPRRYAVCVIYSIMQGPLKKSKKNQLQKGGFISGWKCFRQRRADKPTNEILKVTSYKLIVAIAKLFRGELRPKKSQKQTHPNQYRTDTCLQFRTVLCPSDWQL